MNGFDLSTITNAYVGSTPASAIYLGSTLIWPTGPHDYSTDYLTFEIIYSGTLTWRKTTSLGTPDKTISYSTDNGHTWTSVTSSYNGTLIGNFTTGAKILFKGSNNNYGTVHPDGCYFSGTSTYNIYGNVMSLFYGDNFYNQTSLPQVEETYTFTVADTTTTVRLTSLPYLFSGVNNSSNIISVDNLILPATTLKEHCYERLFWNQTYILGAPVLPATTLVDWCYYEMFEGCSSLDLVTCYATDISATSCLTNWLRDVSPTGTFYKDANTTWPSGSSGIPSGWTIEDI